MSESERRIKRRPGQGRLKLSSHDGRRMRLKLVAGVCWSLQPSIVRPACFNLVNLRLLLAEFGAERVTEADQRFDRQKKQAKREVEGR